MEKQKHMTIMICLFLLLLCLAASAVYSFPAAEKSSEEAAETGMFGMVLIDIQDDEAATFYHVEHQGVYVLAIDEESPAYHAGIRSGDRVKSVNGVNVSSTGDFVRLQDEAASMRLMEFVFHREREDLQMFIRLQHLEGTD